MRPSWKAELDSFLSQSNLHAAEDAKPQEIEVGPSKHDPFLKLQAVDLCLDLSLAPRA